MKSLFVAFLSIYSVSAHAGSADINCKAYSQGMNIEVNVHVDEVTDFNSGSGTVYINGDAVSSFDGDEVNVNLWTRSIRGTNSNGDSFAARLQDLNRGTGILQQLSVPSRSIEIANVYAECWLRN